MLLLFMILWFPYFLVSILQYIYIYNKQTELQAPKIRGVCLADSRGDSRRYLAFGQVIAACVPWFTGWGGKRVDARDAFVQKAKESLSFPGICFLIWSTKYHKKGYYPKVNRCELLDYFWIVVDIISISQISPFGNSWWIFHNVETWCCSIQKSMPFVYGMIVIDMIDTHTHSLFFVVVPTCSSYVICIYINGF